MSQLGGGMEVTKHMSLNLGHKCMLLTGTLVVTGQSRPQNVRIQVSTNLVKQGQTRMKTRTNKRRLLALSYANRALQVSVGTKRVIRLTCVSGVPSGESVDSKMAQPEVRNGNKTHGKNMGKPLNVPLGNMVLDHSSLRARLSTN
eukprot:2825097-Amphidinium_carterae.1